MFSRFILAGLVMVNASLAFAGNAYTNEYLNIEMIAPFSIQETTSPDWAGTIQIKFEQSIPWANGGSCRPEAVAVRKEDDHLISVILVAYTTGKPIRIYADDNLKVSGDYCFLRAVALKN